MQVTKRYMPLKLEALKKRSKNTFKCIQIYRRILITAWVGSKEELIHRVTLSLSWHSIAYTVIWVKSATLTLCLKQSFQTSFQFHTTLLCWKYPSVFGPLHKKQYFECNTFLLRIRQVTQCLHSQFAW